MTTPMEGNLNLGVLTRLMVKVIKGTASPFAFFWIIIIPCFENPIKCLFLIFKSIGLSSSNKRKSYGSGLKAKSVFVL